MLYWRESVIKGKVEHVAVVLDEDGLKLELTAADIEWLKKIKVTIEPEPKKK